MYLAFKEMRKNRSKYLVIIGVLISLIYIVLFTVGLSKGLEYFGASKIIDSTAQTFLLAEETSGRMEQSQFGPARAEELINEMGIGGSYIGVQPSTVFNQSLGEEAPNFGIFYLTMPKDSFMAPTLVKGRLPENEQEVLASGYIEQEGVELGQTIHDDNFNATYTIVGITENETYNYSAIIYQDANQYANVTPQGAFLGFSNISAIVLEDPVEAIPDFVHDYDIDITDRSEIIRSTPGLLQQSASFTLLVISLYIVTSTVVGMFFYIVTAQGRNEYGLLKALGMKTKDLYKLVFTKIATVMGVALVAAVGLITLTNLFLPSTVPFRFSLVYILSVSSIFILVALLGSLVSIRVVSKIDPINAIESKY